MALAGATDKRFFRYTGMRKTQAKVMSLPLNAARVFACVVRHASIQRAAAELCVTPGAVSRQVMALEAALGVALLERRHRAVVPTREGLALAARLSPALDEIAAALSACGPGQRSSAMALTVDVTPTFALHWLMPRLPSFHREYPEIVLSLRTSQGIVQAAVDVDLHIRRDPAQFAGLNSRPFLPETALLVAAPALCARGVTSPHLTDRPLIRMRSRPDLWPAWFAAFPLPRVPEYLDFDNTILAIQAACQGMGVALIPTLFLGDLLKTGVLQAWPGCRPLHSGDYRVLDGRGRSPAAAKFTAWLIRTAAVA